MCISSIIKKLIVILIILVASTVYSMTSIQDKLANLDKSYHGRIGLSALNTENNDYVQYRANERFPFCSTSKFMAVAAVLKKSMSEDGLLNKKISYKVEDLVEYSPVTEKHVKEGMTLSAIAEAAMTISDNTAMNLLLKELGGSSEVTQFARSIGDAQFRLDRLEPELNTAIPGDIRDTTTPAAMTKNLEKLLLGTTLAPTQQDQLLIWLKHNTTGDHRIRAGVPKNWIVGDKTGGGSYYGVTNDIGIIYPPHCKPIVLAIYFTQYKKDAQRCEEVVAKATRMVIDEFSQHDDCLLKDLHNEKHYYSKL